jgi:hypothetical protein
VKSARHGKTSITYFLSCVETLKQNQNKTKQNKISESRKGTILGTEEGNQRVGGKKGVEGRVEMIKALYVHAWKYHPETHQLYN